MDFDKSQVSMSLWDDSFIKCYKETIETGKEAVKFSDVDEHVIERSKQIIEWKELN